MKVPIPFLVIALALLAGALAAQEPEGSEIPADTEIKSLPSGLEYSVLKAAEEGPTPRFGDTVKVHYTGWLAKDGTKFDSSVDRGEPAEFVLGQVVEGWNQGVSLMSKGATYKLHVPAALGYGARGRPGIPPDSDLVFVVELLDFTRGPELPSFPKLDPEQMKNTEGGLQYRVVAPGTGESAKDDEVVVIDYTIWNADGRIIDSTKMKGRRPTQVVGSRPGLKFIKEMLAIGLKDGTTCDMKVKPELAFGDRDQGPRCPPNTTTVWQVEVVKVQRPMAIPDFVKPDPASLTTTESGLQYEVVKEGKENGKTPSGLDRCQVHYAGWLEDGTLFDSSYGRGAPFTTGLSGVIQGWIEGLQLMKEGAVYRFVIPSKLGYGDRGAPPKIPGGATLIFQIELVSVETPS